MKCQECGLEFDAPEELTHQRVPCPKCGATTRSLEDDVSLGLHASDHIMLEAQRQGRTVGFRESERDGRVASADDHQDGRVSFTLNGTSPQGEEDTLATCRILVRAMNLLGEAWNEPVSMRHVDCVATEATGKLLRIQVVKAIIERGLCQKLNTSGTVAKPEAPVRDLVELLRQAIQKKKLKIPETGRGHLVLALEATRLPALSFDAVVEVFREQYHDYLKEEGFQNVWVVGPTESMVKRLDMPPPFSAERMEPAG